LGYLLVSFGRLDEGLSHLEQAQALAPAEVNRVMLATALPIVYASVEDVARRRRRLEMNLDRLLAEGVTIDVTNAMVPTNFFAAYQGYDDCDVQRKLSRLYRAPQPVEKRAPKAQGGRIRVGFLSSHFCDHTIGRLNLGRVKLLDRQKFEVTIIMLGHPRDAMADEFRRAADRLVEPAGSLEAIRGQVAELALDVLVFTDVGMNATTYTLALSRLAGVQCVSNASMDYFISSELLETPQADAHYTERLVRLANLGTYYYRPRLAGERTRESFGLDPSGHVYLCPQTLFKMHPEFDAILGGILRRDPAGELVLIEGRRPQWTALLRERFERTLGDVAGRIRFFPPLANADFLELNATADVLLDTIHFGGGNTSYEGLALGIPIVTLPGPYLRSRITQALYRKMGVLDCVVDSPERYIDLAVRLGREREFRAAVRRKISDAAGVLFEDPEEVRELERFFVWAADSERMKDEG
jgi:predicted O-linked N-acetylglucosamine transferase (SPINDLY family)